MHVGLKHEAHFIILVVQLRVTELGEEEPTVLKWQQVVVLLGNVSQRCLYEVDVTIEGPKDLTTNVFGPQILICLPLELLEERLNFCDFHSLVLIAIKHLEDVHNDLIRHLMILEGSHSVRELV